MYYNYNLQASGGLVLRSVLFNTFHFSSTHGGMKYGIFFFFLDIFQNFLSFKLRVDFVCISISVTTEEFLVRKVCGKLQSDLFTRNLRARKHSEFGTRNTEQSDRLCDCFLWGCLLQRQSNGAFLKKCEYPTANIRKLRQQYSESSENFFFIF